MLPLRGRRRHGPHPCARNLAPGWEAAIVSSSGGFSPWTAFETGKLVVGYFAADEFVQHDDAHDGKVSGFEKDDASSTELVVYSWKENSAGAEDDEGEEVEWRVEVGESIGSGCLQDVNTVDVKILLASVGDDARK